MLRCFTGRIVCGVYFLEQEEIKRLRAEDREAGRGRAWWTRQGPCSTPIPKTNGTGTCERCGWQHAPRLHPWEVREILDSLKREEADR